VTLLGNCALRKKQLAGSTPLEQSFICNSQYTHAYRHIYLLTIASIANSTLYFLVEKPVDKMSEAHLLVFGDQTETAIPMDELLQHSHKSKYISQYLQDSFIAVQNTLDSLSDAEKERFKFDSFQSLAEKVRLEKTPDIVLRTLMLCVAQLGSLILLDLSITFHAVKLLTLHLVL
jgi:hypothetical protein